MTAADGWITIGTELSTDKFDRQVKKLEKGLRVIDKENDLDFTIYGLKEVDKDTEKLEQMKTELENVTRIIDESKGLDFTIKGLGGALQNSENVKTAMKDIQEIAQSSVGFKQYDSSLIQNFVDNYGKVENSTEKINENIEKTNQEIIRTTNNSKKLKDGFNNVSSSIQKAVKKVTSLALGIFGIRAAYSAVRRASSELANYDKQYATNLEYIRFVLTQAIAPILRGIVQLTSQLLQYINMIVSALFGVNLFANGSAESFQKMKAGASGVGKAVKEIKKQLMGFDEMNILTDTSNTGTSAGAGGVTMPDFDLSVLQSEPPEWLKWITDHKEEILAVLGGIAGGLLAMKLGLSGIKSLGIGVMLAGIIYTIESLLDYLNDPSWEKFGKIIQGIGLTILGLGIAIAETPVIIAGAIVLILGTIIKYWDQIKEFLQNGINWLLSKVDWVRENFGIVGEAIYRTLIKNMQSVLNWFDNTINNIKKIFDGIIMFIKGVFTGNWKLAWEGIKQIFSSIFNSIVNTAVTIFNIIFGKAVAISSKTGETIANVFKAVVNAVLRTIENILNSPIRAVNNLIGVINKVPGINLGYLSTFSLPRLKTGGIINMPNKGTLVGSAIGGEAGKEGVIPLTDQQAMSELGREIGKNVLINLTNITTLNGRTLNRELKKMQNNTNFAYNT